MVTGSALVTTGRPPGLLRIISRPACADKACPVKILTKNSPVTANIFFYVSSKFGDEYQLIVIDRCLAGTTLARQRQFSAEIQTGRNIPIWISSLNFHTALANSVHLSCQLFISRWPTGKYEVHGWSNREVMPSQSQVTCQKEIINFCVAPVWCAIISSTSQRGTRLNLLSPAKCIIQNTKLL